MILRTILLGMILFSLFLTAALAADKANFSGDWVMDKSKSEGLPANMDQKMKVTQDGDKLDLTTDIFIEDNVSTVHDGYVINGKEVEFSSRLSNGQETKGKRVAKWNADGKGFEVSEESVFDTPEGKVTVTLQRKWTLLADGKTVVIELNRKTPDGTFITKRTFNRK